MNDDVCVHHHLFHIAAKWPQKVALILDDQSITYAEMATYVQRLALDILSQGVETGQVICQLVDRSLEMLLGMFATLTAGCVYCSLNPADPPARLTAKMEKLGIYSAKVILCHKLTRDKFSVLKTSTTLSCLQIDDQLAVLSAVYDDDLVRLSSIQVNGSSLCYVTGTSGSTGQPKMVAHTHSSALHYTHSMIVDGLVQSMDNLLQLASCTWVAHILEILIAMMSGATLNILRPDGPLNLPYLTKVIEEQQITWALFSPTFSRSLLSYFQLTGTGKQCLATIQRILTGGEPLPWTLAKQLHALLPVQTIHYNVHGASECSIGIHYQVPRMDSTRVETDSNDQILVPSGLPVTGISKYVVDEDFQLINESGQVGELLYGGGCLFKEYLNDQEKTEKVLIRVPHLTNDEQLLYRTGDMAKYTEDGDLIVTGRLDFQFKIQDQRIEAGEVEHIIIAFAPTIISNCIVMKAVHKEQDHLIAYLAVGKNEDKIDVDALRQYCQEHLASFSVPSLFVFLEVFPVLPNGKTDRNQFPPPDFSSLGRITQDNELPSTDLEKMIHEFWCNLLHLEQVSINADLFSLSGNSLQLMRLISQYHVTFGLEQRQLNMDDFLKNRTIAHHARILEGYVSNTINGQQQQQQRKSEEVTVHRTDGPASYAQERIWLDQQIRFDQHQAPIAMYNIALVFKLEFGPLSVQRLRQALSLVINKHSTLRTVLKLNNDCLWQYILPSNQQNFEFKESSVLNDEELTTIIIDEETNRSLFDIEQGHIVRLHIVRRQNDSEKKDELLPNDIIIFNFHHSAFDGSSIKPFFTDFINAYRDQKLMLLDSNTMTYLDYASYERSIDFTEDKQFWEKILYDYDFTKHVAFPYDHPECLAFPRSGRGQAISFELDTQLIDSIVHFTNVTNISLYQVFLTSYLVYLFKLTQHESDLYVLNVIANRLHHELHSMVGMFVNTIPCRLHLDPQSSFDEFAVTVQNFIIKAIVHSQLPYQQIVSSNSNTANTLFLFETKEEYAESDTISIGDEIRLNHAGSPNGSRSRVATFDLILTVRCDLNNKHVKILFTYSKDLFEESTVHIMAQRFHILLQQIFEQNNGRQRPIFTLTLLLSDEIKLQREANNTQLEYKDDNEQQRTKSTISQVFSQQAVNLSQKVAVELDEQSLTYSELLYYVQRVALHLKVNYDLKSSDIVCQCVERSISMVVGILSIMMAGAIYCPLSPRDPEHRLHTLIKQTQSRVVLVHWLTDDKFKSDHATFYIDEVVNAYKLTNDNELDQLSSITITSENIAYIIFTSGSTGIPKAAQIRHRNFLECIRSLVHIGTFSETDTVAQMARCSFDIHMQDIVGTLIIGATLIILHPKGNMDFDYLAQVFKNKHITHMHAVPTVFHSFFEYVQENNYGSAVAFLRSICSGGESLSIKLIQLLNDLLTPTCRIWNLYGPAEATMDCTYHLVDRTKTCTNIPIGRPLPNYQCLIVDEYLQPIPIGQEGELLVGGVGVFAGYYKREDLTAKALINVDGHMFYRTGDLVRMDNHGLIHHIGREDHQIKLRGQRIELAEIERCLLDTSISACVVIKWNDDHLIAYVQSHDIDEEQLHAHCQSHLPPFMVPSMFIILERLPLTANGKIDRNALPKPDFNVPINDDKDSHANPPSKLEIELQNIYMEAFHFHSLPDVNISFGRLGGTSLGAMRALSLIRQKICSQINANIILANPSIRQLANVLQSLITDKKFDTDTRSIKNNEDNLPRPMPSIVIETIGILLLASLWILPIIFIVSYSLLLFLFIVPLIHLCAYVLCKRLLFPLGMSQMQDVLFSSNYYRWWFLQRMWTLNTFWLSHLLGTPFYNAYLRLCGARIGRHTIIDTTFIDAPDLLEIADSTYIGDEAVLSSLTYYDRTFELHPIRIGSNCSIACRTVLYNGVEMEERVLVKSMSPLTGYISSGSIIDGLSQDIDKEQTIAKKNYNALSKSQEVFQFISILTILSLNIFICTFTFSCLPTMIPLFIRLAIVWLAWSTGRMMMCILLLKFIVGQAQPGLYPLNSWYFLHKLWLRQLVVRSMASSFVSNVGPYHLLFPRLLQYLGAQIDEVNDIRISQAQFLLAFPTNLIHIESGVTVNGFVLFIPFTVTIDGLCKVDCIRLGSNAQLANHCTIHPGTHIAKQTLVGTMTRIDEETNTLVDDDNSGGVLLGIPAQLMPFVRDSQVSSSENQLCSNVYHDLARSACIQFLVKAIVVFQFIHAPALLLINFFLAEYFISFFFFALPREIRSLDCVNPWQYQLSAILTLDFYTFIAPLLGGTQWLVILLRRLKANIGQDVIIGEMSAVEDWKHVTLKSHVRLSTTAKVQCHTDEGRIHKLVPVTIGSYSRLFHWAFVFPGAHAKGNNTIYPLTLIMKDDELPKNTEWRGCPAT